MMNVVNIQRQSAQVIHYTLADEKLQLVRSLDCDPEFADFIIRAWKKRDACGFTIAKTPKGKETVIYVIPTTDGISLALQPKLPLKILHTEKDDSNTSMVQITLEDK